MTTINSSSANPEGESSKGGASSGGASVTASHPPLGGESKPPSDPEVPPILFEGDEPAPAPFGGPGQKYFVGTSPAAEQFKPKEFAPTYATGRLLLVARDPHCLYAHWDLAREEQRRFNALSASKHLVIRVHQDSLSSQPVRELEVHPESEHWFIDVPHAGAAYIAELGYYQTDSSWAAIAASQSVRTPWETSAEDKPVQFMTIPMEISVAPASAPIDALRPSQGSGYSTQPSGTGAPATSSQLSAPDLSRSAPALSELVSEAPAQISRRALAAQSETQWLLSGPGAQWTEAQERALAELIWMTYLRRDWISSMDIVEVLRRQREQEISSLAAAQFGLPVSVSSFLAISSLAGEQPPWPGFWLNVNAELVIYGATDPGARVTIGTRPIQLRSDGTFSYRFALPDGAYELSVTATKPEQAPRRADLWFSRRSAYQGEVGTHPQDPALKIPAAENVME